MNTTTTLNDFNKWVLIVALCVFMHVSQLRAQIQDSGSSAPGTLDYGFLSSSIGYNASARGPYSFAFGDSTLASGTGSTAFGAFTTASGYYTTAFGQNSSASGYDATAFGLSTTASGSYATAFGFGSMAIGYASTAFGTFSYAYGTGSTAFGGGRAYYFMATAFGEGTASGAYSTASGWYGTANGFASTASGYRTTAEALDSFVVGSCNVGGGNPVVMSGTNPVFEVGNGTYDSSTHTASPSDALEVFQNGNVVVSGTLTAQPGGDIPMFSGY